MKTICEVHKEISKISRKKWYYGRQPDTVEEWVDVYNSMQWYFDDIDTLVEEALDMWQRMEDGLKWRKEFMIQKWIEEEYQS
jgi:hypothetical protein